MNPKVDEYLKKSTRWQQETKKLRKILLACQLNEELKWRQPCYTFEDSNIVIIQGFKEYLALMFFKGVLLKDPKGILQKVGPNARIGRQIRFTKAQEITQLEATLKTYIKQAIELEKAGQKVPKDKSKPTLPAELKKKLAKNAKLKAAFEALTPGRQRGYCIYFSSAKQTATREARIDKCAAKILQGKGWNER